MNYLILAILTLNTLLLVGIANSIVKLLQFFNGGAAGPAKGKDQWRKIIQERRSLELQGRNTRTYAETPLTEPNPTWIKNWDGVPKLSE